MKTFYRKINAMNTDAHIFIVTDDSALRVENDIDEVEKYLINFEKSFSRFLLSSELSKLNNSSDKKFKASEEMIEILSLSKKYHKETEKIFDPTVANALVALGYNKSFELLSENVCPTKINMSDTEMFDKLKIDEKNQTITKPLEMKIDLGGIGKGYAVNKISEHLCSIGYNSFWVSAGGDIFLTGMDEEKRAWEIGVQNPLKHSEDLFIIKLIDNKTAIATSGTTKRVWGDKKEGLHHIIDPRTQSSVKNNLLSATVLSSNIIAADIFAKTALVLGEKEGIDFINKEKNAECVLIDKDLNIFLSKNMNKYLTKK